MPAAALWRWVLLCLAQRPAVVVCWLLLTVWVPLLMRLHPISSSQDALGMALSWCYPAGLVGALLGLVTLSGGEAFLKRLDSRTRWVGEAGALLGATILL